MLKKIKKELKKGRTLLQFGFLKAAGKALGMLAPLVIAKFFASAELFGNYSLAKMIVFFFAMLLIASSQTPFIVFANQERAQTGKINKTFSVQLTFLAFSFGIFLAVTLSLGKYITEFAQITRVDLFFVLLAFVGIAFKAFLCNLFMALGQRIKNSLAELVFGTISVCLVFVFYFTGTINLRTALLIYPISAFILVLIFIMTIDFGKLLPLSIDKRYFREMFNFTKWVMLGATAVYFVNWGDNLVLKLYNTMADIGTYNVGYQVFKGVTTLTFVVGRYFLPFISQHIQDKDKIRDYLYNKRPKILLMGFVAIALLFAFAPYLFKVIFGQVYEGSVTVLRILLVASVITVRTDRLCYSRNTLITYVRGSRD